MVDQPESGADQVNRVAGLTARRTTWVRPTSPT